MAQSFSTVISINADENCFEFYSMTGKNRSTLGLEKVPFRSRLFGEEFYRDLSEALSKYISKHPTGNAAQITLVLPDLAIAQDTVMVPTTQKNTMEANLNALFVAQYKNLDGLKINKTLAHHNKQYTTFALTMIRKELLSALYAACSINKLAAKIVMSASTSTACAVANLRPQYKNNNFIFLDVKENYSRFVFCVKERAAGWYSLPFGYASLKDNRMPQEDMLFEHAFAELTVLNAQEKARKKALTLMGGENSENNNGEGSAGGESDDGLVTAESVAAATQASQEPKVLRKKVARKLPKSMLRPTATSPEGFMYENFRVFIKWALTLIQRNPNLIEQGMPEFLLVNLPEEYVAVIDLANENNEENGLRVVDFQARNEHNENLTLHLELFGALCPCKNNSMNVF